MHYLYVPNDCDILQSCGHFHFSYFFYFPACKNKLDLGFALDVSGSVAQEFNTAKDFIVSLAEPFSVSQDGTRVSYIGFATNPDSYFPKFNEIGSLSDLRNEILLKQNTGKEISL